MATRVPPLQESGQTAKHGPPPAADLHQRLAALSQSIDGVYEALPYASYALTPDGRFAQVNARARAWLGCSADELIGKCTPQEFLTPAGRERLQAQGSADEVELELVSRRGVLRRVALCRAAGVGLARRTHCFELGELSRRRSRQRVEAAAASPCVRLLTDERGDLLAVDRRFSALAGWSAMARTRREQWLGGDAHRGSSADEIWGELLFQGHWQGEVQIRRADGGCFAAWLSLAVVPARTGNALRCSGDLIDISAMVPALAGRPSPALVDTLTQLPNRQLLQDRLARALDAANGGFERGALLLLDLDNFKGINDTRGHGAGDRLLTQVAQRLRHAVRDEDFVARLGGDEFAVLLTALSDEAREASRQAGGVAEKIRAALAQPFQFADFEFSCSASIGISLLKPDATVAELLQQTDLAMYQAKRAGRNRCQLFERKLLLSYADRTELEQELQRAVRLRQFELHYQPQVDAQGRIFGAEALLRWRHPQRGLLSPAGFMPLAEETGLILAIGEWVLHAACSQLQSWQRCPMLSELQLAVNVSAHQFAQTDFVGRVLDSLRRHRIDATRLKLELTESTVHDIADTRGKMEALCREGIRFAMDDFGTGYSSLINLTRLPLSQLKIDRSFVQAMADNAGAAVVVQATLGMARSLGLEVVAEGVETEPQMRQLQEQGCSGFQGYLFGRPVPLEVFEEQVRRQGSRPV